MNFRWLKQVMPRGLYGRAALILILPVVTIQLVVSVVFIQRHFERVTRQMTEGMVREIVLLDQVVTKAATIEAARERLAELDEALGFITALPAPASVAKNRGDRRKFLDLTGIVVLSTLHENLPAIRSIDLVSDDNKVAVALETPKGLLSVIFPRGRVSASNPHQLLVLMVFVSILMTLIAYLFLRNQLRPIRRLARAAEAFGKGRNVDYRVSGATEVRSAGSAFLDMRARIERQIEQRTLMLSGVSHDLRTPLTRLRLALSMMPESPDVEAMERDVDEMGRLVDAFLDFAREGATQGNPETLEICGFVRGVVEDAQRAGQKVTLVGCEGGETATFRPDALRRAFENLIGNANRYGERAEVTVSIGKTGWRIAVHDDGPGIAPERRDEAMRPFTRLDPARNQDRGQGVGLGLSIAADILRSHGGSLKLGHSERLGGLMAEMILPR
ncbi:two-component sensor histidine kinase [Thioclava sp. L04-15]|uniref:ATP-binding protein n=1 Tax=Thioclava sp. L04-15 TaxID=1915318 RepID=UPI000998D0CB|nr:ATP-binding protein [Thioclava sp. L04-15]OOY26774.1 two-component sensor histidine kinase [Thioclava sp. L04-15]TNE83948.1 MAG: HAMP domain-containing protein [Paracoccaceae bacterium]